MKPPRNFSLKPVDKGRPDYYITPTRDFTKYAKDCEEKYWSKETAFDWKQDIQDNLKAHLEQLHPARFAKIALMTLPMLEQTLKRRIFEIRQQGLPVEEDALKGIAASIPNDKATIQQALLFQLPLRRVQLTVITLKDRVDILQTELSDLREQHRLGFFKEGIKVRHLETDEERRNQCATISQQTEQLAQVKKEYEQIKTASENEGRRLQAEIRQKLDTIEYQVLVDLEETLKLVQQILKSQNLPDHPDDLAILKELILKRQLHGLKDIANHALVVEQSAIAPLTMGIIHYKRHREIQEAMTTFINDEAKHSATFRRYLAEKLEAKEYISAKLIKGANRYLWLARYMPGVGLFFAVVVEAIGAAVLEFFGDEAYMPDDLFCSICKTISDQDEVRHINLCVDMYNELFRKGHRWEQFQNRLGLRILMKSVYGDKTEDNHLIQAFRAFGIESNLLYQHIFNRVSEQLARIGMYVEPEMFFRFIGRKPGGK